MTYFDYNSTTPVDPRVLEEMLPFFTEHFGNASSITHAFGWYAQGAIDKARQQVATFIDAESNEVIFTSGATESINLALKGVFEAYRTKGNHIITCKTEHKAVLDTCAYLEELGAEITYLTVDMEGRIDLDEFKESFKPATILVSIMAANNETGVLQDLEKLSAITHQKNAIFFSDTTQLAGKLMINVNDMGLDLCTISSHKLYGPKGVGALYVRRKDPRVNIIPLLHGGGHEKRFRSGTLNVPGIVGLGKACEISQNNLWDNNTHISKMRGYIEHQLLEIPNLRINGSTRYRLYNTSNLYFPMLSDGSTVFSHIKSNFAVALGSACTSAQAQPSHVLQAMELSKQESENSIRISIGIQNSQIDVENFVKTILSLYNINSSK